MAGPNDFYVSFGSDASAFGGKLQKDLAGARAEIALFQADLAKLGQGPAGSALARLLTGIKGAQGGAAPAPATAPTATAGGAQLDYGQMARDAASWHAEIEGLISRMGTLVRVTEEFQRRSAANSASVRTQDRHTAESAAAAGLSPSGKPYRAGQLVSAGAGGTPSVRTAPVAAAREATIQGTTRVQIDDAAFQRVVDAVERNVGATDDVRRSIETLTDRLTTRVAGGAAATANAPERRGQKKKGRAPEQAGSAAETVDPAKDAAFTRASELRAQIAARQRLTALRKLQAGINNEGQGVTPQLISAASGGSQKFLTDMLEGRTARIPKAISSLQGQLAGVPKLKQLEAELEQAIAATGTTDGRRSGVYREVAADRRQTQKAQPAPAVAQQARDTSVEAIRSERETAIAQLRAGLAPLTTTRAALADGGGSAKKIAKLDAAIEKITARIQELDKPLARERSAANRAAAQKARDEGPAVLPQQHRVEAARDIALAGDPDALRESVRKREIGKTDLRRIASTFTEQGYDTPFNTKSTNEQLMQAIAASRKAYEEAGRITAHDLTSSGRKIATTISKTARQLLKEIYEAVTPTEIEQWSRDIVRENALTGGTSTALQNREGQARTPGHAIRGAAFGGRGDDLVSAAEHALAQRQSRVAQADVFSAQRVLQKNPNFNPYDPKLRAGIEGTSDEAKQWRQALAGLTRGIAAIDKAMDSKLRTGSGRDDWLGREVSPEVRAGINLRAQARQALENEREQRDALMRAQPSHRDVANSTFEAMFGAGTALGSGRINPALSRLLPGVAQNRSGNLRPSDRDAMAPEEFRPLQTAFSRAKRAMNQLNMLQRDGSATAEQLEHAQHEIDRQISRVYTAYERVFKTKLPTADFTRTNEMGYDPKLGYGQPETIRTYSLAQQHTAVQDDKRQDALARARSNREGPDEASLKLQAKNARDLARVIAGVSNDQGKFRNRKGANVDIDETIASATRRQQAIEEGKREPGSGRPELRRQFEAITRPTVQGLQQELERAARGVERNQARVNAPDAELASPVQARLRAAVEKQRAIVESANASDTQRIAAQRALTAAHKRLTQSESALAEEERKRAREAVDKYTAQRTQAAGKLAALDPTVRNAAQESQMQAYLEKVAAQTARRNAAESAYQAAAHQQRNYEAGKPGAEHVPEKRGLELRQNAIYEDYMLSQIPRPPAGRQATKDDQLAALQRAAAAYAEQTKTAYDTKRGKKPPTDNGGGGTGTGTGEPVGGGHGAGDDILRRILAELVSIHGTLKGGLKVSRTGARSGRASEPGQEAAWSANAPAAASKRQMAAQAEFGTEAGRQSYLASLPEDLRNAWAGEDKLGAAVQLVERNFANQTRAVALYRAELIHAGTELSDVERRARTFKDSLKATIDDRGLAASVTRGKEADDARRAAAAEQQAALQRRSSQSGGYAPSLGYGPNIVAARQSSQLSEQDAAAERARARAKGTVADTTRRLTEATKNEVTALRDLVRTGAQSEQVAAQQVRAYAAMAAELTRAGLSAGQAKQRIQAVFQNVGAPSKSTEIDDISKAAAGQGGGQARQAGRGIGNQMGQGVGEGYQNALQSVLFGNNGFYSRVIHSVGTFLVRNASAGLVFGMTNALQDAIQQGVETESTFIRVSDALDQTGRSSAGLRTQLQGISQDYGVALKDIYTTAAGLTGLFDANDKGNEQLVRLTRVAAQLQIISGGALNATEAMRSLSSVTSAYGPQAGDMAQTPEHIGDVLTAVYNQLGTNIEESIEGVARLSGQARLMGIDFEHAATWVAAISKFTGQSGAASGEQLSRMLESLQKGTTQNVVAKALGGSGVDVRGAFAVHDYQTAVDSLMQSYGGLSRAQQSQIAVAIGGARQAAATQAWLIEGSKNLSTINAAYHANGLAQSRAAKISEQLTNQMSRARSAFVNFFAALERAGALNAFGAVLITARIALEAINRALSGMNDLIDSSPFTQTVAKWITTIAGLVLGFKLAQRAAAGMIAAMNVPVVAGMLGRRGAAGAAGAAEGEAAAAGAAGTSTAGRAGEAGMLAMLFRRNGDRMRAGRDPNQFAAAASRRGAVQMEEGLSAEQRAERLRYREMQAEAMAKAPAGSAMLTPLGRSAVRGQFGPVDENGTPGGFRQRTLARQSVRLQNASLFLGNRAESLRAAAETRQLGGYARGLGYGDETRVPLRSRAVARGQLAGAGVLQGGSRAAAGAEQGLAAMSRHVGVATAAFGGIAIAAGLLIATWKHHQQMVESIDIGYQAAFGAQKPRVDNPTRAQNAHTYFDKVSQDNINAHGTSAIGSLLDPQALGLNFGTLGSNLIHPSSRGLLNGISASQRADAGVTSSDQDFKYFIKPLTDTSKRIRGAGTNLQAIDKAIRTNEKEINKTAAEIKGSDMTDGQKVALLSSLADWQDRLHASQNRRRLAALGMNKLDVLTTDSMQAIGGIVNSIVGFGSDVTSQFGPLLAKYASETGGFAEGSTYDRQIKQLIANRAVDRKVGNKWEMINPDYQNSGYAPGGSTYNSQVPEAAREQTRTRAMTKSERQSAGVDVLKTAALAGQAQISAMSSDDLKTDEGQKTLQAAYANVNTWYQAVAQQLQTDAASAQAIADLARENGNFAGAANQSAALIANAQKQLAHQDITPAEFQLRRAQIINQAAQDKANQATKPFDDAKLRTRDPRALANLELKAATAALQELKSNGADYATRRAARERLYAAVNAQQDAENAYALSLQQTTELQNSPRNNALVNATNALNDARTKVSQAAATYGRSSVQYQDALREEINAERAVDQAVRDQADAASNLLIARANERGNLIEAARRQLALAKRNYERALRDSGGDKNDKSVVDAASAVTTSEGNLRDTMFQDSMDTISFNQQMGRITSAGAIAQLQQLLKNKDLTRAQRRQILLQIHGLQQSLVSDLTSSGFNIPGGIKLPTPYEVRRSLGVDKIQQVVKTSFDDATKAKKVINDATFQHLGAGGGQASDLLKAMQQVHDAVRANGATKVSVHQENKISAPTAHVAQQIANAVIALINQQNGQHHRANATTPRLVPTR